MWKDGIVFWVTEETQFLIDCGGKGRNMHTLDHYQLFLRVITSIVTKNLKLRRQPKGDIL